MKSEAPTTQPEASIRILKMASCPSLSGQSTLAYHIGCTADGEVHFRVSANSHAGFFSREWVALKAVQAVLEKAPGDGPVRSFQLYPLFRGRSLNTPGFLLAVLKHAGLVQAAAGKRGYERVDPAAWMAEVKALMDSGVSLQVQEDPKPAKKAHPEAPAKTASAAPKAKGRPRKSP